MYLCKIQKYTKYIIKNIFKQFLKNSWDYNSKEFSNDKDQTREILIRKSYFSKKDIEHCLSFNINLLEQEKNFTKIKKIFKKFQKEYSENWFLYYLFILCNLFIK